MTANETPDTITVDLPIGAEGERVGVFGTTLARDTWREIAAGKGSAWVSEFAKHIAPAVVAWMDRDEREPLDVPEIGRTIKATLRNGRVETFEVKSVGDYDTRWVEVWKVDASREVRYIQLKRDPYLHDSNDIIAWEYVDEWEPLDLPVVDRTIKATLRDGRVETFKVGKVGDGSTWAYVSKADSDGWELYLQRVRDVDNPSPGDIIAWEYADEADPINVPADGSMISATFGDGSVRVIAVRWAARIGKIAGVIQSSITQYRVGEWADDHADPQRDITSWEYVDEPDADLAAIADKIAAAVNELREAIG